MPVEKFDESGRNMKLHGGVDILSPSDREAACNLFESLGKYGLFVVRRGELESWLQGLGGAARKSEWLIDVFEKMGEDPDSSKYLHPGSDDVWEFMRSIKSWLTNAKRSGIPS